MTFINEYIPEADYDKYDLRRICGEHNLRMRQGHMHSNHWTISRERDAFLIKVWAYHESEFSGWAFYWKGHWMFFEETGMGGGGPRPDGSCWFGYRIKDFSVPEEIQQQSEEVIGDLTQAFADNCGGGVFSPYKNGTTTIEFI